MCFLWRNRIHVLSVKCQTKTKNLSITEIQFAFKVKLLQALPKCKKLAPITMTKNKNLLELIAFRSFNMHSLSQKKKLQLTKLTKTLILDLLKKLPPK